MSAFPLSLLPSPISTTALSLVVATADFTQPPRMTRISHSFSSGLVATATSNLVQRAVAGKQPSSASSILEDSLQDSIIPASSADEDDSFCTTSDDSLLSSTDSASTAATDDECDEFPPFDVGEVNHKQESRAFPTFAECEPASFLLLESTDSPTTVDTADEAQLDDPPKLSITFIASTLRSSSAFVVPARAAKAPVYLDLHLNPLPLPELDSVDSADAPSYETPDWLRDDYTGEDESESSGPSIEPTTNLTFLDHPLDLSIPALPPRHPHPPMRPHTPCIRPESRHARCGLLHPDCAVVECKWGIPSALRRLELVAQQDEDEVVREDARKFVARLKEARRDLAEEALAVHMEEEEEEEEL
ncbi:hypothetical protein Rhopal_001408-T1 [Rhodotorula paludigena]|uniref:Uncharacterized protein n=1 Tax=Rhodotorula paludigena TaxID=86838 RepID=A0AAV5GGD9_9BASI|nr:hypothetical protein Rhopal_001408-T1 [Rhodotorula paludigena]